MAQATGSIDCTAVDDPEISASLLVSRLDGHMVMPLRAEFNVGDGLLWTAPQDGTEPIEGARTIVPVHQYGDAHTTVVEYADDNVLGIVVTLRLVKSGSGGDHALGGVLSVPDVGAWVVSCVEG